MIKYYGASICKDCVAASSALADEKNIEYIDITASTVNLKAFLKLRDTREEFVSVRSEGRIGIPCFVLEDGSISFDIHTILTSANAQFTCDSCG